VFLLSWMGEGSAYQFVVNGGQKSVGLRLGMLFGILTGLLVFAAGMVCFMTVSTQRYAIPNWVGQLAVMLLGLLALVLMFLAGIGGLAGPPRDKSVPAEFARTLHSWLPLIPSIAVIVVVESALVWRSVRIGAGEPGFRLPLAVGATVASLIIICVAVAAATTS
jgi:hypothetical protein